MPNRTRELSSSDPRHGTTAGYIAGCRCDRCREASRLYRAAQKAAGLPDPEDSRHGTVGGFTNYHCRCERCRDAMRTWDATRRRPTRQQEMQDSHRRWYVANRERRRAQIRRYMAENQAAIAVTTARYRKANQDAIREYFRSPEGQAARRRGQAKRRAVRKGAPVSDVREADEYRKLIAGDPCSYCGAPAEHADHIVPLASGGPEAWDNLTAACGPCNLRKNARDLLTFLMIRAG